MGYVDWVIVSIYGDYNCSNQPKQSGTQTIFHTGSIFQGLRKYQHKNRQTQNASQQSVEKSFQFNGSKIILGHEVTLSEH